MAEMTPGPGWWIASDGRWYPPALHPAARPLPPPVPTVQPLPPPVPPAYPEAAPYAPFGGAGLPAHGAVARPAGTAPTAPWGTEALPPAPSRHRRERRTFLLVAAALVLAAGVVAYEVVHPSHGGPSPGTAVAVAGQPINILPDPDFLSVCSTSAYDDSNACVSTTTQAIDHARTREGLGALTLPSNWDALTPAEQLFVATNLERTARRLAPISDMTGPLDGVALSAATSGTDPQLAAGGSLTTVAGNWIQGYSNPLEALYQWVYDDGLGSNNLDCTRQDLTECWGHRANVLLPFACTACQLGAAYAPTDREGAPLTFAEVLVETSAPQPATFTWAQEQPYLP